MALGSYFDLGKHFYSNLFTFILFGIEPALPKPGHAHIPISVCSQIRGNRPTKTTMHESNSFRSTEILEHLMSPGESSPRPTPSQARGSAARKTADAESNSAADVVVEGVIGEITEQFRLREILEEARVLTGATGAAIALARGKELVCLATAGATPLILAYALIPIADSPVPAFRIANCSGVMTPRRIPALIPKLAGNWVLGQLRFSRWYEETSCWAFLKFFLQAPTLSVRTNSTACGL